MQGFKPPTKLSLISYSPSFIHPNQWLELSGTRYVREHCPWGCLWRGFRFRYKGCMGAEVAFVFCDSCLVCSVVNFCETEVKAPTSKTSVASPYASFRSVQDPSVFSWYFLDNKQCARHRAEPKTDHKPAITISSLEIMSKIA